MKSTPACPIPHQVSGTFDLCNARSHGLSLEPSAVHVEPAVHLDVNEHPVDLQLARDIGDGLVDPWHEFVTRYSGLIFSIVRRYLADYDEEVHRDAYVQVLEYMYSSGLRKYDGRAALSTWIMTVARSRSLDVRRRMCGRRRDPVWLARLSARDQEVFRRYFENGEDIATIRARFAHRGEVVTHADIERSLERIEARLDRRLRTRLAYDLHARSFGVTSGSLLGYLDQLRLDQAEVADKLRPDIQLMQRAARVFLERISRSLEALDPEERKVVELHYYQQLAASRIAAEMGLPGPRRVYTLIDRALAHLRRVLGSSPHNVNGNGPAIVRMKAQNPPEGGVDRAARG